VVDPSELLATAAAHLRLALAAVVVGALGSVPLGIFAARRPRLGAAVLAAASVVQTIPSLALLAFAVPVFAAVGATSIGFGPAFAALVAYSALPVVRNTVTGLRGLDPALLDAADGLGMTASQRLWWVELPLAAPTLLAGVRTATTWTVGTATLATPIGATSLGDLIFGGLQTRNHGSVLVGCLAAAGLALALDAALVLASTAWEQRDRGRGALAVVVGLALGGVALAPLAGGGRSGGPPIVIGAKTFTEQYVLAELLAIRAAEAGVAPEVRGSLGSTVAFDALVAGDVDVYVDYSGTLWATILEEPAGADRATILRETTRRLRDEHGVTVVCALGFQNTYAFAMRADRAAALHVRTLGDLAAHAPTLTAGGDYEFFARPEWRAVQATYGLAFADRRSMDPSLLYDAVRNGDVDVASAFSTDGRLDAYGLTVLVDDRGAIPPYDAVVLASARLVRERPDVVDALRGLAGTLTDERMRAANRAVDEQGATPREVAEGLAR
jgi:osmoprotectant transport system permease protein